MPTAASELHHKIVQHEAHVCVTGQGYVGLSAASALAVEGFPVLALDVDPERIAALGEGRLVVPGVDEGLFAVGFVTGRMTFTTDTNVIGSANVVLVCVPTPVVDHPPDLSHVEAAGRSIAPLLRSGSLVVLESTTYAGTTEQLLRPILEQSGMRSGRDFFLAFSPERIDPGNVKYGLRTTQRVVGGDGHDTSALAGAFYAQIVDVVATLSSSRAAETAKLLENTYRMVNTALVNELATLCSEQDIYVWEVIAAAATKPFGFQAFTPGQGRGGIASRSTPRTSPGSREGTPGVPSAWSSWPRTSTSRCRATSPNGSWTLLTSTVNRSRARGFSRWESRTSPTSVTSASQRQSRSSGGWLARVPVCRSTTPS